MLGYAAATAVGLIAGGAAMYYIQPTVKLWVARAFGWEAQAAAYFERASADARAAQARVEADIRKAQGKPPET
jgi:hypothetical protein